jgi:hypothetical protein
VPTSIAFGISTDDSATCAPGSAGTSGTAATGASFTVDTIGGYPRQDMTGGSVDTEAYGNKYGTNTLPGVQGNQPKGTGAPGSGDGGAVTNGSQRIND